MILLAQLGVALTLLGLLMVVLAPRFVRFPDELVEGVGFGIAALGAALALMALGFVVVMG